MGKLGRPPPPASRIFGTKQAPRATTPFPPQRPRPRPPGSLPPRRTVRPGPCPRLPGADARVRPRATIKCRASGHPLRNRPFARTSPRASRSRRLRLPGLAIHRSKRVNDPGVVAGERRASGGGVPDRLRRPHPPRPPRPPRPARKQPRRRPSRRKPRGALRTDVRPRRPRVRGRC